MVSGRRFARRPPLAPDAFDNAREFLKGHVYVRRHRVPPRKIEVISELPHPFDHFSGRQRWLRHGHVACNVLQCPVNTWGLVQVGEYQSGRVTESTLLALAAAAASGIRQLTQGRVTIPTATVRAVAARSLPRRSAARLCVTRGIGARIPELACQRRREETKRSSRGALNAAWPECTGTVDPRVASGTRAARSCSSSSFCCLCAVEETAALAPGHSVGGLAQFDNGVY